MFKRLLRRLFPAALAGLFLTTAASAAVRNLTASDYQQLLKKSPNLFLLDVRTPGENAEMRIKGSHLIPIDQVQARINEIPRDRPVVVYCATAVRSGQVARYLDSRGYPEVYNLTGGIMGWQVRGFPVERGQR